MLSGRPPSTQLGIDQLLDRLVSGSSRQKRSTASALEKVSDQLSGQADIALKAYSSEGDDWGAGWILQILQRHHPEALDAITRVSSGWFQMPSSCGIDYADLQSALLKEEFEEADRLTSCALRQLAGEQAVERGYVYFSEVPSMKPLDLTTIDRLWPKIGWKNEGVWTRYPGSFQWCMDAPEGHMPLVNQLRGVRLMDALLQHPGLASRS